MITYLKIAQEGVQNPGNKYANISINDSMYYIFYN